jgi:hypothetical protein
LVDGLVPGKLGPHRRPALGRNEHGHGHHHDLAPLPADPGLALVERIAEHAGHRGDRPGAALAGRDPERAEIADDVPEGAALVDQPPHHQADDVGLGLVELEPAV